MAVKKYKPTSAGRRQMATSSFEEITRSTPEKSLLEPLKKSGGRNNRGRITTRHQGGGHKRRYRKIDFKRVKDGVPAKVASIEYDPNRSARIALLHYADGAKAYILAPVGLRVGATVQAGTGADIKPGNALPLADIPTGTVVHAVELRPGQGAKLARSAGSGIQLVAKDAPYGVLRLPSGEMRRVLLACRATGKMPRVVFNAVAISHSPNHFEVELRTLRNPLGFHKLVVFLEVGDTFLQLLFDARNGPLIPIRRNEIVRIRIDHDFRKLPERLPRQWIDFVNRIDHVTEQLNP